MGSCHDDKTLPPEKGRRVPTGQREGEARASEPGSKAHRLGRRFRVAAWNQEPLHLSVCVRPCVRLNFVCMCDYICLHVCWCMFVFMYVHLCLKLACVWICLCVCTCVSVHICVCVCICA